METLKPDWSKSNLVPVVVQEVQSGDVLMLAYMDNEAYELTLKTGIAHYYSRSKKRIWKKGEESGNIQVVKEILIDCDEDSILLKVEQIGGCACHTGNRSCFYRKIKNNFNGDGSKCDDFDILDSKVQDLSNKYSISDTLYHTILERKKGDPSTSYVAKLFSKGENSILKKVAEEAAEFCFALKDKDEKEIVYEAADLFFHTLVALAICDINPDRIKQELKRREGISGIEEKNNRVKS